MVFLPPMLNLMEHHKLHPKAMVHLRPHPRVMDPSQCHCPYRSNQDPSSFLKDLHPRNHPSTNPDPDHLHHPRGQLIDHLLHPRGSLHHQSLNTSPSLSTDHLHQRLLNTSLKSPSTSLHHHPSNNSLTNLKLHPHTNPNLNLSKPLVVETKLGSNHKVTCPRSPAWTSLARRT